LIEARRRQYPEAGARGAMTPPHRLLHPPGDAYQIGVDARELQCLYVSKQPTTREFVSQTLE
jgi:hypothetical protein